MRQTVIKRRPDKLLTCLSVLAVSIGCATSASAQDQEPGIKIGEEAPAFTLKNQGGEDVSLKDLLAKNPTAIVFHRSADW